MSKKKKKYRGRLLGYWGYDPDVEKLQKIQEKFRTRSFAATLRELVRKEKV